MNMTAKQRQQPILLRPVDPAFDQPVMTMVKAIMPQGFAVTGNAPSTFEELRQHLDAGHTLEVWSGASEHTIYGSPEVNHAFRAWHDHCHYVGGFPFTLPGEAATALLQIEQLERVLRPSDAAMRRFKVLLLAEVVGQAVYHVIHDRFPDDQRRFVKAFAEVIGDPQAAALHPSAQHKR